MTQISGRAEPGEDGKQDPEEHTWKNALDSAELNAYVLIIMTVVHLN